MFTRSKNSLANQKFRLNYLKKCLKTIDSGANFQTLKEVNFQENLLPITFKESQSSSMYLTLQRRIDKKKVCF